MSYEEVRHRSGVVVVFLSLILVSLSLSLSLTRLSLFVSHTSTQHCGTMYRDAASDYGKQCSGRGVLIIGLHERVEQESQHPRASQVNSQRGSECGVDMLNDHRWAHSSKPRQWLLSECAYPTAARRSQRERGDNVVICVWFARTRAAQLNLAHPACDAVRHTVGERVC